MRDPTHTPRCLTDLQTRVAGDTAAYLGSNLDRRITIGQLASQFHVSQTYLKQSFRMMHGQSVYAWHRRRKMERAADLLAGTNRPILEIASECGYDNGSKFASAFRQVMGESPTEFRRTHQEQTQ